uniref:EamA domain-containing protein n=1 Tax=Solibacter usitatus (strain Ellin6076) TaxID=234267 RepID=Q02AY6_SOLUE
MAPTPSPSIRRRPDIVPLLLAFAAIYFVWGSTFLAIRFAVETLPPLITMGTRHLMAGGLLFLWLRFRGEPLPEPRLWRPALFSGAFCFLGCHGLLAWAEKTVPSGLAALLSATLPVWMILLARMLGQGSELTLKVMGGITLGFLGVAVLVPFHSGARDGIPWTSLAIIVCEIFWAIGAIFSRGVKGTVPPATFAAMQMLCGGVLLWTLGLILGEGSQLHPESFTTRSVVSLAYLIVFGSLITFTAYVWLLQVCSPALVSTHSYINPVVAIFCGWALGGEPLTARTLAGTAIILASVALVSVRKS